MLNKYPVILKLCCYVLRYNSCDTKASCECDVCLEGSIHVEGVDTGSGQRDDRMCVRRLHAVIRGAAAAAVNSGDAGAGSKGLGWGQRVL